MIQVSLSDEYKQQLTITTEDNYTFGFSLEYRPNLQAWYWSLSYNNLTINNQKLVIDPNFLRKYISYLPFAMQCGCATQQVDPFLLDDFTTGRINLYTMTAAEALQLEKTVYGTVL